MKCFPKSYLFWDLDGTLIDPKEGITRCIQHALRVNMRYVPEQSALIWCIGPPLQQSFLKMLPESSAAEITSLITAYRDRYSSIGLFENTVYEKIPETLEIWQLRKQLVVTSKPTVFAEKIIAHYGLSKFFHRVYGSELSGLRSDKGELLAHVLMQEAIDPKSVWMIGDRDYDAKGAASVGIDSLGVKWGYGGPGELELAGCRYIFEEPTELGAFLRVEKNSRLRG